MPQMTTRLARLAKDSPPVVVVGGEVDPVTAPDLGAFIAANFGLEESISLDLTNTTFADCALLQVLDAERILRAEHSATVIVVKASAAVLRLLEVSGQDQYLREAGASHSLSAPQYSG